MKKMKKLLALLLAFSLVCATPVSGYAAEVEPEGTDCEAVIVGLDNALAHINDLEVLTDAGKTRGNEIPTYTWKWSNGVYSRSFDIIQYTYTSVCFTPNANNKIYYAITNGSSNKKQECSVKSYCSTCGDVQLAKYTFTPTDDFEAHRILTVASQHAGHSIYFKIVAFEGGWFFSNNDFSGLFTVSNSSTL